jgi:hypothetical protein
MKYAVMAIATCLLTAPSIAQGDPESDELIFARSSDKGCSLEATTRFDLRRYESPPAQLPVVDEVQCRIARNGMQVHLDRRGRINIRLGGELSAGPEGEERSFIWAQVRRIRLDGIPYESRVRQTLYFPWRFNDVTYPTIPDEDIILPVLQGHLEVRRGPEFPWLPLEGLTESLLNGRTLEIGYADLVDEKLGPISWFRVPLQGLRRSVSWCQNQIESPEAYRFKGR